MIVLGSLGGLHPVEYIFAVPWLLVVEDFNSFLLDHITQFPESKYIIWEIFAIYCNIIVRRAIINAIMVGAMAKFIEQTENNIVHRARTQAYALGQLYELYYERIFRFCVYRLFDKEIAEDVTSTVFLEVARRIRTFAGRDEQDFGNWLYAIAINQINSYIRKTSRRRKLLAEATDLIRAKRDEHNGNLPEPNWPRLYAAILKLKAQHQTIITLRFFENLPYEQIAHILNIKETTLRVKVHRILNDLRSHLLNVSDEEV